MFDKVLLHLISPDLLITTLVIITISVWIFASHQCENGHIACSSCCLKLRSKCPVCALPIGNYRCRIMERDVEAIIVPCPNAKHGCTEKFSYGKEIAHEKECGFALCYCPTPNCKYTGVYKGPLQSLLCQPQGQGLVELFHVCPFQWRMAIHKREDFNPSRI